MEGRKAICLCLLALACLQTIQQISATRKALLASVLGDLRPSGCDSAYGIIGENPAPLPNPKFDLVAELLHIRRLLERGCNTIGSPLSGSLSGGLGSPFSSPLNGALGSPLSGALGSPSDGPLAEALNSPLNGAVSSSFSGPLSGALNSPLNGALSSPVGGPLSSPSLGSGLTNFPPNILHGRFSGLLHN